MTLSHIAANLRQEDKGLAGFKNFRLEMIQIGRQTEHEEGTEVTFACLYCELFSGRLKGRDLIPTRMGK